MTKADLGPRLLVQYRGPLSALGTENTPFFFTEFCRAPGGADDLEAH
ncbi:hypothetical protein MYX84_07100 [Acidobacteria bacterium AH-259-O06]|nr:hypothetical protein [Acidobacteria bacterium AH-259-O06]